MKSNDIPIHNEQDFASMRKAGKLAASILDRLNYLIKPGISTLEINDYCHNLIITRVQLLLYLLNPYWHLCHY